MSVILAATFGVWCWVHDRERSYVTPLYHDRSYEDVTAELKRYIPPDMRDLHIFCARAEEDVVKDAYHVTVTSEPIGRRQFGIVP